MLCNVDFLFAILCMFTILNCQNLVSESFGGKNNLNRGIFTGFLLAIFKGYFKTICIVDSVHLFLSLSDCVYSYFRMSWNIEAFSLCVLLLPNLRVVPHGMKGTGPKFVTRPVYLRSQFRNNANTVLL